MRLKKISAFIIAITGCLLFGNLKVEAASYPTATPLQLGVYGSVGEKIQFGLLISHKYNNERITGRLLDEAGNEVATWETSSLFTNGYTSRKAYQFDSEGYKPGRYIAEFYLEFYSLYKWNTAPYTDRVYIILNDDLNKGVKDHNMYTGSETTIDARVEGVQTAIENKMCQSLSAWRTTNFDNNFTFQLTKLYLDDDGDEKAGSYALLGNDSRHWILGDFEITNTSDTELDVNELFYNIEYYRYNGNPMNIIEKKYPSIGTTVAPGETIVVTAGILTMKNNGMPYIAFKNGNGFTYLNINPNAIDIVQHSYVNTVTKATLTKNGKIEKKCSLDGAKAGTTVIYYPKTIKVNETIVTYTGKALKPKVTIKDAIGKVIDPKYYTLKYTNNVNVGTGKVTITFKGNYSGSITKTFTIGPKTTILSSVKAAKKSFKATWKKQATQTNGYLLQYSLTKDFKDAKTKVISKNSTLSTNITKLASKKTYYVRVRTFKTVSKTKVYSVWSNVKTIVVK